MFYKKSLFILICMFLLTCNDSYGTLITYDDSDLYYTSNITSHEAHKLGTYLVEGEFFTPGNTVSVQIDKTGKTYEFRMVVKKGIEKDPEYIEIAKLMAYALSEDVFNGSPVDIHLCDPYFETIRVVVWLY